MSEANEIHAGGIPIAGVPQSRFVDVERSYDFPLLDADDVHFLSFAAEKNQIIDVVTVTATVAATTAAAAASTQESEGVDAPNVVVAEDDGGGGDVVNAKTGSADHERVEFAGGRPTDEGACEVERRESASKESKEK